MITEGALILVSGGQESASCHASALDGFTSAETLAFRYGQRHEVELECCSKMLKRILGRNILFLAALAYSRPKPAIDGMCETDYSGYPPCRNDAIKALEVALNRRRVQQCEPHTSLMWLDTAATWHLSRRLGGSDLVGLIGEYSHNCYRGERLARHEWGCGRKTCPSFRTSRSRLQSFPGEVAS